MNSFKFAKKLGCQRQGCNKQYSKDKAVTYKMYGHTIFFCSEKCKKEWLIPQTLRGGEVIAVCKKHHDKIEKEVLQRTRIVGRANLEESKFTCSICNKVIMNKEGHYIKFDSNRSIKVCKMHVPDKKANKQDLEAYRFVKRGK